MKEYLSCIFYSYVKTWFSILPINFQNHLKTIQFLQALWDQSGIGQAEEVAVSNVQLALYFTTRLAVHNQYIASEHHILRELSFQEMW